MEPVLFLSHRIPYPPNKGDKLRSYHLLNELTSRYRVYLGTFIDDERDWAHLPELEKRCAGVFAVPRGRSAYLRALGAVLRGRCFSTACYTNGALAEWAARIVREHGIKRAMLFSSPVATMVPPEADLRVVADFVDVDSEKWRQYASRRPWPLSAVFRREADLLLAFERSVAQRVAITAFAADAEAALFKERAPECASVTISARNGVDANYFSPQPDLPSPYADASRYLVFTGVMNYWPNVDAVVWFTKKVLPWIRAMAPDVRFAIVGMNPSSEVARLAGDAGVLVTGAVPDVRPYVQHAAAVVAPLRIARGIQNKVLEAMAMAKPVVLTEACAKGVGATMGREIEASDHPRRFAELVLRVLDPETGAAMGAAARARVLADYDWHRNLAPLVAALEARGPRDPATLVQGPLPMAPVHA